MKLYHYNDTHDEIKGSRFNTLFAFENGTDYSSIDEINAAIDDASIRFSTEEEEEWMRYALDELVDELKHPGWRYGVFQHEIEVDLGKCLDLTKNKNWEFPCDRPGEKNIIKSAIEKGYDSVIVPDYTSGIEHRSYIVLNYK